MMQNEPPEPKQLWAADDTNEPFEPKYLQTGDGATRASWTKIDTVQILTIRV